MSFADDVSGWVRVTLDVDNGASGHTVTFYTSSDGVTWTQLGTATTRGGTSALYYPSVRYEIGARTVSSEPVVDGRIYYVEIRNGIAGNPVTPVSPDNWEPHDDVGTFGGSPTLYVINCAQSGAYMGYVNDVTRFPKMTPRWFNTQLIYAAYSHNDAYERGSTILARWDTLYSACRARFPYAPFVVGMTEPPHRPRDMDSEPSGAAFRVAELGCV